MCTSISHWWTDRSINPYCNCGKFCWYSKWTYPRPVKYDLEKLELKLRRREDKVTIEDKSIRDQIRENFNFLDTVVKRHINYLHYVLYWFSLIEKNDFVISDEIRKKIVSFLDDMETKGFAYIKHWRAK